MMDISINDDENLNMKSKHMIDVNEDDDVGEIENQILQISPERQEAFIEFIRSIPRICSPTVLEISSSTTQKQSSRHVSIFSPKFSIDNQSSTNNDDDYDQFNWSIEEYSDFYGKDFSNHNEQEEFHSLLDTVDLISKELDEENEKFFSQDKILSSPPTQSSSSSSSLIEKNQTFFSNDSISRNTGSFIRWLDSIPFHSTTGGGFESHYTTTTNSSNQQFFESAIVMNDISMKSETNDDHDHHHIDCEKHLNNETDSDFDSMMNDEMECHTLSFHSDGRKLSFMETSTMKCTTPKITAYRYDIGLNSGGGGGVNCSIPMIFPIDDIGISPIMASTSNHVAKTFEMNKENFTPIQTNILEQQQSQNGTVKKRPFLRHQYSSLSSSVTVRATKKLNHSSSSSIRSAILLNNHQSRTELPPLQSSSSIIIDSNKSIDDHFKTPQTATRIRRSRISRARLFFTNEINAQSTPDSRQPLIHE